MTFTKLFASITESTIWCEDDQTRIVWITMLAMANKNGFVFGSAPGLANRARVPLEAVRSALVKFLSPDLDSRTKDYEGRRIEEVDGGWRLLNYEKHRERDGPYRGMESQGYVYYIAEVGSPSVKIGFSVNPWARLCDLKVTNPKLQILALERGTMQSEKERHSQFSDSRQGGEWFSMSQSLNRLIVELSKKQMICKKRNETFNPHRETTVVLPKATVLTEAEAEADKNKIKVKSIAPTLEEVQHYFQKLGSVYFLQDGEAFFDYYSSNGWKVGGRAPMKDWKAAARRWYRNDTRNGTRWRNGDGRIPSKAEQRTRTNRERIVDELGLGPMLGRDDAPVQDGTAAGGKPPVAKVLGRGAPGND